MPVRIEYFPVKLKPVAFFFVTRLGFLQYVPVLEEINLPSLYIKLYRTSNFTWAEKNNKKTNWVLITL